MRHGAMVAIAILFLTCAGSAVGSGPVATVLSQTPCAAPPEQSSDALALGPALGPLHANAGVPGTPNPCSMGGQAIVAFHDLQGSPASAAADPAAFAGSLVASPPIGVLAEQQIVVSVEAAAGEVSALVAAPLGSSIGARAERPSEAEGLAGSGGALASGSAVAGAALAPGAVPASAPHDAPMITPASEERQSVAAAGESSPVLGLGPGIAAAIGSLLLAGLALYTRLSRGKELEHALRAALYDDLRATGPATAAELARRRGVHLTTILYHLRKLESAGLLRAHDTPRGCLWAPPGTALEQAPKVEGLRDQLQAAVCTSRGVSASTLAERHGVHLTTVLYHLKRLAAEGTIAPHQAASGTYWTAHGARPDLAALEATRVDVARRIAAAVAERPGASPAELARHVGARSDHVRYHLQRLARSGIVRSADDDRWFTAPLPAAAIQASA